MEKIRNLQFEDQEMDATLSRSLLSLRIDDAPRREAPSPSSNPQHALEVLRHIDQSSKILNDETEIDFGKLLDNADVEEDIGDSSDPPLRALDDAYDENMNEIVVDLSDSSAEQSDEDSNDEIDGCYPSDVSSEDEYFSDDD